MIKKILKLLVKLPLYILKDIIYFISSIIPKNKNLWIFGSWDGQKFADNSKYLFIYVNEQHPEIRPIWLAKNSKVIKLLQEKGYEAYKSYSFKGFKYSMRASCVVVSCQLSDVNRFAICGAKKIQLWHGTPLKKILHDNIVTGLESYKRKSPIKRFLLTLYRKALKFTGIHYDLLIATSREAREKLSSAFKIPENRIPITGYPRNDILLNADWLRSDENCFFKELRRQMAVSKVIAYLPTFRDNRNIDLLNNYGFSFDAVDEFLEKTQAILWIKTHTADENLSRIKNESSTKRILIFSDRNLPDNYPLLKKTDILITDYSSVYFDFLLLNRPIIFAPFDLAEYVRNDRELYYEYNEVTPGPKAKNWPKVLKLIEKVMQEDKWKQRRKEICRSFNEYKDGKSSKRVFEEIKKIVNANRKIGYEYIPQWKSFSKGT